MLVPWFARNAPVNIMSVLSLPKSRESLALRQGGADLLDVTGEMVFVFLFQDLSPIITEDGKST